MKHHLLQKCSFFPIKLTALAAGGWGEQRTAEYRISEDRTTPLKRRKRCIELILFWIPDTVDWLSGCKYGFIPYLQNNWTLHASTVVTF
jgi:hypothetical protein